MNSKSIEKRIAQAYAAATPDLVPSLLSERDTQKGKIIMIQEKKRPNPVARRFAAVAAAFLIMITGFCSYKVYDSNYATAATVSLDVNPGIEIEVNEKEHVLSVTALNADGKAVIGAMDFTGSSLDIAVNALIGSMLKNGYINELANSILISVSGRDAAVESKLQAQLSDEVAALLTTDSFNGAVLSQTVAKNDELATLADTYGISSGKAQLIETIITGNPTYSAAELAKLSINELNLLIKNTDDTLLASGSASDKAYIGGDAAKATVFASAGVSEAQVRDLEAEMDYHRGRMVYEVEFELNGVEYEYDVDAITGEIIAQRVPGNGAQNSSQPATAPDGGVGDPAAADTNIGKEAAKAAALKSVGLTEADVQGLHVKLDYENGKPVYDVEFHSGNMEYDYEIDAGSGAVLYSDADPDDLDDRYDDDHDDHYDDDDDDRYDDDDDRYDDDDD